MKNYIKNTSEIKGKTTAFTEIIIDAPLEIVRETFLDFKKWDEWNTVFTKLKVKKGDINNIDSKPRLGFDINFGRKNDPSPSPISPTVYQNSPEIFHWGFNYGILKANHVYVFEPINAISTRFINYEEVNGLLKGMLMTPSFRENMINNYNNMNAAFKKVCESK